MLKSCKSDIIKRIRLDLDHYQTAVACTISTVKADSMNSIRKQCFNQNNKVVVTKHSLFKIAAEQSSFSAMKDNFTKESIAIVYGHDILSTVKLLSEISSKEKNLNLRFGFVVPGQYLTNNDLKAIADLPSLEVIRANLIGKLQGVMQKILFITKEPMRKIAFLLKNKK